MSNLVTPAHVDLTTAPHLPHSPEAPAVRSDEAGPTHPHSPAGDQRERAVACRMCQRSTWNVCAQCNAHCDHGFARPVVHLAVSLLGLLALVLGLLTIPAGHAAAVVIPLALPVKVVLAGPVSTLSTSVVATAPTTGHGPGRWIAVSAPIGGRQQRVGYGASATTVVPVRIPLRSSSFVLGRSTWMTRDLGDDQLTPLPVDARQASRFAGARVVAAMPGYVLATARVQHWSVKASTWSPSQASPVLVQVCAAGRWTTIGTLTTDSTGAAGALLPAPSGQSAYRLVRPDGATVWAATSATLLADTGDAWDY